MKKITGFILTSLLTLQLAYSDENRTLSVEKGWNALSFNGSQTLEVLKTKMGLSNLLIVQGEGAVSYKKSFEDDGRDYLNTFTETKLGEGYWMKVDKNATFSYEAEVYTEAKTLALIAGWNFVGPLNEMNLTQIKKQIGEENLLVIQGAGQGRTYKKSYVDNGTPELNSFTQFEREQGYWVKLISSASLIFDFKAPSLPIDKEVRDNVNHVVEASITIDEKQYTVKVYSTHLAREETSNSNITLYGNINTQRVKFYINSTYPVDSKFQVRVFDAEAKEVKASEALAYNTLAIEFTDIEPSMLTPIKFENFGITKTVHADSSDWDAKVQEEFGSEYRVADWNDLKFYHASGKDLLSLYDGLGLTEYGDRASVKRNGDIRYSTTRYYYASRHVHNKPSHYLAHENIDNYLISLGSWRGSRKIMVIKKSIFLLIDKIKAYANDNSNPAPILQDYIEIGVTGVTSANLEALNAKVATLGSDEVDTVEELNQIVKDLETMSNEYKVTLKSTAKIAGYEVHLEFEDNLPVISDITLDNGFLGTTGRNVSDLGPDINATTKLIKFGAFSFGNAEGVSGNFEPLNFVSDVDIADVSIVKQTCVDKEANEVTCDIELVKK